MEVFWQIFQTLRHRYLTYTPLYDDFSTLYTPFSSGTLLGVRGVKVRGESEEGVWRVYGGGCQGGGCGRDRCTRGESEGGVGWSLLKVRVTVGMGMRMDYRGWY